MTWLDIVLQGVSAVVSQWVAGSEEERKAIEERALTAIRDMVADRNATATAHSERTALTLAVIDSYGAK